MATYNTEVYTALGSLVADISTQATSRKIVKIRNTSVTISLTYDLDAIHTEAIKLGISIFDIFAVGINEVRVKRNNVVIAAGQIQEIDPSVDGDNRTISVTVVGWLDLFAQRFTGANDAYNGVSTDIGQLQWELINTSQALTNGNFGITLGNIQTSNPYTPAYAYKNIKDALIELSAVSGGTDIDITWDKVFNAYYPKIGSDKSKSVIFTYPGNIASMSFKRNGQQIGNQITARGAGNGVSSLTAIAEDFASEAKYKLRQSLLDLNDVSDSDNLQQAANAELVLLHDFIDVPTIKVVGNKGPQYGDYDIGDIVSINVSDTTDVFKPISNSFRIDQISLEVDENNLETVNIGMVA